MFHVISHCYSSKVEDFIVLVIVLMLFFLLHCIVDYLECYSFLHSLFGMLVTQSKKGTSNKKRKFLNFNDFKECLPRDMLFCYIILSNCIKYKTIDFYSFWILEMILMGLRKDLRTLGRILKLKDMKWKFIESKLNWKNLWKYENLLAI